MMEFNTKSGKKVIIKTPEKSDVENIFNFYTKLVGEDTFILRSPGDEPSFEEEEKWLDEKLVDVKNKKTVFLAAFFGDKIVGSVDIRVGLFRFKYVGAVGISIDKDFRGEGLGTELLIAAEREAKKLGLKILKLEVFENNKVAQKLYAKVGFELFGRLPKSVYFRGEFIDAVYMYKRLD